MADPDDQSLLSRLNALKPTTVKLDQSTNALDIPVSGIQPAEPLSKEDALSKRLKTLRNKQEGSGSATSKPQAQGHASRVDEPPPQYSEVVGQHSDPATRSPQQQQQQQQATQPQCTTSPPTANVQVDFGPGPGTGASPASHVMQQDHLTEAGDDRTLDDILDSLVIEDDHWSVSDADDGHVQSPQRVQELLASLREEAGQQALIPSSGTSRQYEGRKEKHDDDDDDSEGEQMSRQINNVLSRTLDEIKLENHATEPNSPLLPSETDTGHPDSPTSQPQDINLTLPDVPETPTEAEDTTLPELPTTPQLHDDSTAGFKLPTVPSILQDPVPASKAGDPFECSIAARLAALKGPGHIPIATDDFGMPSAPSFQPEERPTRGVSKKPGYTDEDEKTWCIVCLDDATVRCLGCDGVVYCARCWKDMHVGPSAGYDERGHKWETFDRRNV